MPIQEELAGIVGVKNVSDDPEVLKSYSKDRSVSLPHIIRHAR